MDKDHILSEIRRTAAENGGVALGRQRFQNVTGIRTADWAGKFWVRWSDAVKEAGLTPKAFQKAYADEHLLEKLISLIRHLGHFPVTNELILQHNKDFSFPTKNTFEKWGGKEKLLQKVMAYCEKNGVKDVLEICKKVSFAGKKPEEEEMPANADGFVYLAKSNRYFKIGRSNSVGRREYELAIQLPEKLAVIHKIKTDDPEGIEAYWHNRFASKRVNGEWFQLSPTEVGIFRRRKFM